MKKRVAALAICLSALAAMPALADNMRFGDSAAVTGVKDHVVLRTQPNTEADELAQIAQEENVTYLSPEKERRSRSSSWRICTLSWRRNSATSARREKRAT